MLILCVLADEIQTMFDENLASVFGGANGTKSSGAGAASAKSAGAVEASASKKAKGGKTVTSVTPEEPPAPVETSPAKSTPKRKRG
jgi:hypothetical protein